MKTIKGFLGALAVLLGLNSVATWAASSHQTMDGEKVEAKPVGGKTSRSGPPCGGAVR